MSRFLCSVVATLVSVATVHAHMVYLVPSEDGTTITIVFSDDLRPDQRVKMDRFVGMKLHACLDGKHVPVEFTKGDHAFTVKVAKGTSVMYGTAPYGFMTKAEKPSLLVYHPKAVLAGVNDQTITLGAAAALEIVPVRESGTTRFRLLAKGKPVAGAEGTILLPDGSKEKVVTNQDGYTTSFSQTGRYAAYLRLTETTTGEHDGKKYEEIRHYATLVVDVKQ